MNYRRCLLRERWLDLAAQAGREQDPDELSVLVREIDRLLTEKEDRVRHGPRVLKPSE